MLFYMLFVLECTHNVPLPIIEFMMLFELSIESALIALLKSMHTYEVIKELIGLQIIN